MTSHPPDDGFHEIQLNGKQLVFLFMAATVVSVVIFLCGVLVGRGVRTDRGTTESASLVDVPIVDQVTPTSGSDPRNALPPPVNEVTYHERLENPDKVQEELKELKPARTPVDPPQTARVAEPPPVAVMQPAKTPTAAPVKSASTKPTPAAAKQGFAVQLAALNSRGEADAMVKRLSARGYEAYVQDPAAGGPSIFRVRVGKYSTRGEAETAAAKIEKEGQFKPWVDVVR